MNTVNDITVVTNDNKQTFTKYLQSITVECDVNMSNTDYEVLSKLVGRQAYEFVMQLKKVESIEALVSSIESQLQQILNMNNACLSTVTNSTAVATPAPDQASQTVPTCTCSQSFAKYFPDKFYDSLNDLYKKLSNVWKCPYPPNQLAVQLGEIKKTLVEETNSLTTLSCSLQSNATKYYMVKSYRLDVENFLQQL